MAWGILLLFAAEPSVQSVYAGQPTAQAIQHRRSGSALL
jgi:hypothetical protein